MNYIFTVFYEFRILELKLTAALFAYSNELHILCDEVMQLICFPINYNRVVVKY